MTKKFIIEDEAHAEWQAEYGSYEETVVELIRRMKIPWDKEPNLCPCISWRACQRRYEIIEFENSTDKQWKESKRIPALELSSKAINWLLE